ncbi:malate dehydrogenase, cytoplasmic [Monosporozyma servazzii]
MPHQIVNNNTHSIKVCVLGAAGGIGQSLSLLLKTQLHYLLPHSSNKQINLALYDINEEAINGVATDLSHIDTPVAMSWYAKDRIDACLQDANIVVIPAGMPRKPGMTRDDLFNINAHIIKDLTDSIAANCDLSKLFILMISNPVNQLIPVMHYRFKQLAPHSNIERRIFGITKLDIVRASTFLKNSVNDHSLNMPFVPVIGGHSGETIIPLFSQNKLAQNLPAETINSLIQRVQYGGDEVVKAKNGKGSATLSMAHAAFKCVTNFFDLIAGNVTEFDTIAYTTLRDFQNNPIAPGADKLLNKINNTQFFAIQMTVNANGITSINYNMLNNLSTNEQDHLLPTCITQLQNNIQGGQSFVQDLSS